MVEASSSLEMGRPGLIVHLGLPKTATTSLQRRVLNSMPGIRYIGKDSGEARTDEPVYELVQHLLTSGATFWEDEGASLVKALEARVSERGSGEGPVVISHEVLTAACFGWYFPRAGEGRVRLIGLEPWTLGHRLRALAQVLPASWKPMRLVLTLRRQDHFLPSFYAQRYPIFYCAGLGTSESYLEAVLGRQYHSLGGVALEYDRLIGALRAGAGESVELDVLLYEDLSTQPVDFVQRLAGGVSVDGAWVKSELGGGRERVRRTSSSQWVVNRPKRRDYPFLKPAERVLRAVGLYRPLRSASVSEAQMQRIRDHYAASNARLAKLLGREDLAQLGYAVEPSSVEATAGQGAGS